MEFRHLRFFIAVAEDLHFTRAAARLHVAQPHLSQEIRRLEREMDVQLLVRDRRRVTLTAAGKAFLTHAREVLTRTAEAVRATQRVSRGETGILRVGFVSSAAFGVLPDAVRRFRMARPDVQLLLTELNSNEQIELLMGGRLDLSLLHPPRPSESGLIIERILLEPLVVCLPEQHPLARHRRIELGMLAKEPWILFPRAVASCLYDETLRACAAAGFTPQVVQEALKLSTIVSLVASALGVCLVPSSLARLRLWRTVCRPLEEPGAAIPLATMWREVDINPSLRPFLEALREEAQQFVASGTPVLSGGRPRGRRRSVSRT